RHTRWPRDWSSDVCSSDLEAPIGQARDLGLEGPAGESAGCLTDILFRVGADTHAEQLEQLATPVLVDGRPVVLVVAQPEDHRRRSEERRVGKGWRDGWWRD